MSRSVAIPTLLCALLWITACGPKLVRQEVFKNDTVLVELRQHTTSGEAVPRGFNHPATIADVRLAHILASITHEEDGGKRVPTIRSAHVYDLAEGLSKALAEATPDQEVLGVALSRDRRLGIFNDDHVTILSARVQADTLVLDFWAIEDEVEKDERFERDWQPPSEKPSMSPRFKLIPGEGQTRRGARVLLVDWRHPYYRKPVSLRYRFGQIRRRTILMEQGEEVAEELPEAAPDPDALSDAQLRALDQLEAARYSGYVTELEYQRRRRLVMEGKLDEAGYGDQE